MNSEVHKDHSEFRKFLAAQLVIQMFGSTEKFNQFSEQHERADWLDDVELDICIRGFGEPPDTIVEGFENRCSLDS
jgi:hypothetical protein